MISANRPRGVPDQWSSWPAAAASSVAANCSATAWSFAADLPNHSPRCRLAISAALPDGPNQKLSMFSGSVVTDDSKSASAEYSWERDWNGASIATDIHHSGYKAKYGTYASRDSGSPIPCLLDFACLGFGSDTSISWCAV